MKYSKLVKVKCILILFLISTIYGAKFSENAPDGNQTQCEDSCQVCQRVVYQMKFQGFADCDINNGACRGTCYKIKEMWGNGFSQFDQFINDIFGKCEICFRTGFCTISQCKEQEQNELEVINQVLNASKLNARLKPDNKLVSFPDHEDTKSTADVLKTNNKIEKKMKKELKGAINMGTTQNVIPKFQNLVSNYIDQPHTANKKSANEILNGADAPVSSASVSVYNDQVSQGSNQIKQAKQTIDKLDNHIQELKQLKETSKPQKKKAIDKVIKKEEKEINKLVNRVDNATKKLKKDEKVIQNLVNNPKVKDSEVKTALNNSLLQIRQYSSALESVKGGLNQDRNKLKQF